MNLNITPLVLAIFALVFALPTAAVLGAAIPAAIAQEEDDDTSLGKDLAGGILTDIFDGSIDEGVNDDAETGQGPPNAETVNPNQEDQTADQDDDTVTFGDDTNTQTAIPIIEQDQRQANLAEQLAANLDINLIPSSIPNNPTIPECPPGFTLNNNGQCEQTLSEDPTCPTDFTFNPETDQCQRTVSQDPTCPTGFTYSTSANECQQFQSVAPECPPGFTYNTGQNVNSYKVNL